LQDAAGDLANRTAVVDDKAMFHGSLTRMRLGQSLAPRK
jgi:hypothetical protein